MLMCFKLWLWPAAHPLSRLTIMALAQAHDAGLVPQLVWQACLSSHLESRQLAAHHLVQHYAAGSFPGKDCELLIACLTIDMTHTHTQENVRRRHICSVSCTNIQSSLFRYDQNFQRGGAIIHKSLSCSLPCVHKYWYAWYLSDQGVQFIPPLRDDAFTNLWAEMSQSFSSNTPTELAAVNVWVSPSALLANAAS